MRYALAAALLVAVGCSSASSTAEPDPTDARICAAALQVPWNSPLMTSLTLSPATQIQEQARIVVDASAGNGTRFVDEWHSLSDMCVNAGF